MKTQTQPHYSQPNTIADALAVQDFCVMENFFSPALVAALKLELLTTELSSAGIGRDGNTFANADIRRDETRWLDDSSIVQKELSAEMEALRLVLNERLMLGLFDYESHFATYEPGAFYKRHTDSFKGKKNRILSTVLYLNEDWLEADGGLLKLYADNDTPEPFTTIIPTMGRFVLFLSETVPHEVTIANRTRSSIAGWFRCNE